MTLTIDLPDEEIKALAARAQAQGISPEQYARQVLEHDLEAVGPAQRRRIWEVIAENMKHVPSEEFAALPKDSLSQIDHYVYGVPKKTP